MTKTFEVVTGDPVVELHLPDAERSESVAIRPVYSNSASRSARMAALLEAELSLVHACDAIPQGECGGVHVLPDPLRVVQGHDASVAIDRLRAALSMQDSTLPVWAYFNAGCPESTIDAALAREALLRPPDALARNLWPIGIARAIIAAEGPSSAEARVASMRAASDRELAAAIMVELILDARRRHALDRAAVLREELARGKGPWNGSPLVHSLLADNQVVGVPVGSIRLRTLDGELRDPDNMRGQPILLYTAASWCEPCYRDGLADLRAAAAAYPELVVLYVLFDDAQTAGEYVVQHAPIPGTIVLPDDAGRAKIEALLGAPAFPSFVLIDRDGRVAAIPDSNALDTTLRRSGILAPP